MSALLAGLKLAGTVYAIGALVRMWTRFYAGSAPPEGEDAGRTSNRSPGRIVRMVARRIDVGSEGWLRALAGFKEEFKQLPFGTIRNLLEAEFRRSLREVFRDFEAQPFAPGTVAQLHRARLRNGAECVVKVQLPDAWSELRADLRKLNFVLWHVSRALSPFTGRTLMHEVMREVPAQLDFLREARNMDELRARLLQRGDVVIPQVFWRLTTARVLTMEFAEGTPLADLEGEECELDRGVVALQLFEVFSEQVLVHGIFHGDPHPGNILVQRDGRLALIDFGMVKILPEPFRINLARLAEAILAGDNLGIADGFHRLGFRTRHDRPDTYRMLAGVFLGDPVG
ncbi:MAG: AarF/ABC1/UbiB kinase family protein [Candidatus Binataceae bacterium]